MLFVMEKPASPNLKAKKENENRETNQNIVLILNIRRCMKFSTNCLAFLKLLNILKVPQPCQNSPICIFGVFFDKTKLYSR